VCRRAPRGSPTHCLGVSMDRYSFIAADFHHPLLAALPAHQDGSRDDFFASVVTRLDDWSGNPPWLAVRLSQVPQVGASPHSGGAGSTAFRPRLRLVVAGDVGAAIKDLGVALGDRAVECDEFRVEIAGRLRLRHEM
jgi:hypothetical protein